MPNAEPKLERVYKARLHVRKARNEFRTAIRNAHDAGASLREIAKRAGINHETVRSILRKEEP